MLDKTKRYLVVGLGLLGGKYALELSKAGFHVDGINRSEGHLQFALDHGYIERGKTHDFEDLVREADHIIFGLYPTALIEWFRTYGPLLKPGCIFTDVSGVKTGLVEPVQALCPAGVEFIASHVVGLGLLGGKYALELSKAGLHVDGINRSEGHLQFALDHGYIERGKTHDFEDLVREADHIIFGLYPTALIEWFRTYGPLLKPGCIFTDVSGVKTGLVEPVQALCPAGVEFIASHPMAGRETSSVEHAAEVNFAPANFIITPTEKNTPEAIAWVRELAEVLGFKHICTLTVQEHDRMVGYVSQLCHAIAVSLMCANDNTSLCEYTGDSFRDLTRIARINDKMWAELFLWNRDNLISEIDQFDAALGTLRSALVAGDREKLEEMFRLSTQRRAAFDKKLPE